MKKLNKKGYLTIEIILGSVIAFAIAFFLIEITAKMISNNDDTFRDTIITTDNALIISGVKEVVENNKDGINNINCNDNNICYITYKDGNTGTLEIADSTVDGSTVKIVKYVMTKPNDSTSYDSYEKKLDSSLSDIKLTSNITGDEEVTDESNIYFKITGKNIFLDKEYNIIIPIDNLKKNNVCNIPSVTSSTNLVNYITTLYNDGEKEVVTNNNIEYNTVSCLGLMNDRLGGTTPNYDAGNIRYYGENPNNYIYFNCDDYDNPSASTCELWRIIGVFEDEGNAKVKIIRNEKIGQFSWDISYVDKANRISVGINQWGPSSGYDGADLMKLLNPEYESNKDSDYDGNTILVNNSLYWNSKKGKCYIDQSFNYTDDCDFSSTGIKNDITKNMISDSIWYLGNWDTYNVYPDQIYKYERGTKIISRPSDGVTRTTTWTGKIGLLNLSDIGYARDFNKCTIEIRDYYDGTINSSESIECLKNYLIKKDNTIASIWLLNPSNSDEFLVWSTAFSATIIHNTTNSDDIFPTLYLRPGILVKSGNGSIDNPYQIDLNLV